VELGLTGEVASSRERARELALPVSKRWSTRERSSLPRPARHQIPRDRQGLRRGRGRKRLVRVADPAIHPVSAVGVRSLERFMARWIGVRAR
jgi:hypothetical protein